MTEDLTIDGNTLANDAIGRGLLVLAHGIGLGGSAVIIAAATAPDLIAGIIELAPFTRAQPFDLGGLIRVKRFRTGYTQMAQVIMRGRLGELVVIDEAGHYPHVQVPDEVLALPLPFPNRTLTHA